MFDWNRIRRQRLPALMVPRLLPFIAPHRPEYRVHDDSNELKATPPLVVRWPAEVRRPYIGLVQDVDPYPYWTKYRRFLETNQFPFRVIDIHSR